MADLHPHLPPLTSEAILPTGGCLGPLPEHFLVEECLLYATSGQGDHTYLLIQKRGLTTDEAVTRIATWAGCSPSEVGYAGLKDKHAVTRQWISLPRQYGDKLVEGELDLALSVLAKTQHTNKLRTGHLSGNRFELTLVDTVSEAPERARAIMQLLQVRGLPNYFGAQRFGHGGQNLARAQRLLFGREGSAGRAASRFKGPHRQTKLYASVLQSEVFNRYLTARCKLDLGRLLPGEVVRLDGKNAMFAVTAPDIEQPRLEAGDLHPTGPMWGKKMKLAEGAARALEEAALQELGWEREAFDGLGRFAPGARRDCLVRPQNPTVAVTADGLRVGFSLGAGSYATQVVRELTRQPYFTDPRDRIRGPVLERAPGSLHRPLV